MVLVTFAGTKVTRLGRAAVGGIFTAVVLEGGRVKKSKCLLPFVFMAAALSAPVSATSCWLDSFVNQAFVESQSDIIFVGIALAKRTEVFEAIEFEGQKHISAEITTFKVESAEKGSIKRDDEITVEKRGMCSCAGKFSVGNKYLVHARVDKSSGRAILHFCSFNKVIQ